jgi:hypothetical protein
MAWFQCPCCDYFTLPARGEYDICPVCFWEDDGIDLDRPDMHSGPNHMTLREGRHNFRQFGACDRALRAHVTPPQPEDKREERRLPKRQA